VTWSLCSEGVKSSEMYERNTLYEPKYYKWVKGFRGGRPVLTSWVLGSHRLYHALRWRSRSSSVSGITEESAALTKPDPTWEWLKVQTTFYSDGVRKLLDRWTNCRQPMSNHCVIILSKLIIKLPLMFYLSSYKAKCKGAVDLLPKLYHICIHLKS
jgi:hypothetical protein